VDGRLSGFHGCSADDSEEKKSASPLAGIDSQLFRLWPIKTFQSPLPGIKLWLFSP